MSKHNPAYSLPFTCVGYSTNIFEAAAENLIQSHRSEASDFSKSVIWCESTVAIHKFRVALLATAERNNISTLLLPEITTLQNWLWRQCPAEQPFISEASKQLLLMEAIRKSATVFNTDNAWLVAKEIVGLFNELALAQFPLHKGPQEICDLLVSGYQTPITDFQNISRESEIVYKLWVAYNEQIHASHLLDPVQHYCCCLEQLKFEDRNYSFYLLGKHRISKMEEKFLCGIANNNSLSIFYHKVPANCHATSHHALLVYMPDETPEISSGPNRTKLLDSIYTQSSYLQSRIDYVRRQFPSNPFADWLHICTSNTIEKHVAIVCLQSKQWLLENQTSIGIVCNDRLLTRRIRAVLENEGIFANDLGGWALSTTSAATIVELLLEAVESNFNPEVLFDLLINPFLADNFKNSTYLTQTRNLQHHIRQSHIILRGGINAYIEVINNISANEPSAYSELSAHLQHLLKATKSLLHCSYQKEIILYEFANHLISALERLDILPQLDQDEAGKQLLSTLRSSIQTIRGNKITLNWQECRYWLRDILENNYFIPGHVDKRVTLCSFDHLDFVQFTHVILAGVEQNRLNHSFLQRTFFNEKVRRELNLQTSLEQEAINFVRFRQLLEQSEQILFTAETEHHGERQEVSAWIKILNLFSVHAFGETLNESELPTILTAKTKVNQENSGLGLVRMTCPAPHAVPELLPTRLSATKYQSVIDCPYQFFARYMLNLKSIEFSEDLDASEFGQLVHKSLYRFHFSSDKRAIHQKEEYTDKQRENLIENLIRISTEVFSQTPYPEAIWEGWLQRWLTNIPSYVDWYLHHNRTWHPKYGEHFLTTPLTENFELHGHIDRVDFSAEGLSVIDYKTGTVPSKVSVMDGETVQLPFYALLSDEIIEAEYLELGKQGIASGKVNLNQSDLKLLKTQHKDRLTTLISALKQGSSLPATGTNNICKYCDYEGLCRKSQWQVAENSS